jgi:hypothetical protein
MGELPQRTTANTPAEHAADHNQMHENFGGGMYVSGRYYAIPYIAGAATTIHGEGDLDVVRWVFPGGVSLVAIAEEVVTAGTTGAVRRLGIYADSSGLPGALLHDAGTYDATTTGNKELTFTAEDVGGQVVWIGGVTQGAAGTRPAMRTVNTGTLPGIGLTTIAISTGNHMGFRHASVSGALPDPFTSTPVLSATIARHVVKIA